MEAQGQEEVTPKKKRARVYRKSTPRNKGKHPRNSAASQRLKELWADPEWREKQLEKQRRRYYEEFAKDPQRFYRTGIPDGMRRDEARRVEAEAMESAKKTVEELEANGFFKDDEAAAKEALEMNIAVMRGRHSIRDRLAAASKVLEYTKSKPVAKSEVTVNKAEEWLAQVAEDLNDEKGSAETGA